MIDGPTAAKRLSLVRKKGALGAAGGWIEKGRKDSANHDNNFNKASKLQQMDGSSGQWKHEEKRMNGS